MVDGTLTFDTKIDTSGISNAKSTITSSVSSIGSVFKKLGKIVAAAISVKAIVNFSKEAIEAASDLQEVQNVVDTAFGSMSDSVDKWSKTTVEKFGMSELKAKQYSSTYMAMGKGMGLDAESAANMAISATERIGDIASFYNMSFENVDTMMKSIWTGETESLKKIGVVMTETNLKAFALSQGITQNYEDMDQATKTQLRYAYVMQQTSLAEGDFQKTSGSWANQTRILSEQFNTLKTSLGTGLIQALTPALQYLNMLMSKLNKLASAFSSFTASLFGKQSLTSSATDSTDAIDSATDAETDLGNAVDATTEKQKRQLAGFDELNKLGSDDSSDSSGSSGTSSLISSSLGDIETSIDVDSSGAEQTLNKLSDKIQKIKNLFINYFSPMSESLKETESIATGMWNDLKNLGSPLKDWFSGDFKDYIFSYIDTISAMMKGLWDDINMVVSSLWDTVIYPFVESFVTDLLPIITQFGTQFNKTVKKAFTSVNEIFQSVWMGGVVPVLELVSDIWTSLCKSFKKFWDSYGAPIFNNIRACITTTKSVILTLWEETLQPLVKWVIRYAKDIWDQHLSPLVDEILSLAGEIILCVTNIYNKVAPIIGTIVSVIVNQLGGAFKKILTILRPIITTVIDLFKSFVTVVKGVIQVISGIFSGDWKKIMTGFKTIASGALNGVKAIFKTVLNAIIGFFESAINKCIKAVNTLLKPVRLLNGKTIAGIEIDIPEFNAVSLPRLASGTVVPANYGEFAAILGDNKREAEVVSPLSTMKQAMSEVLQELAFDANINMTIEMDGDKLTYKVIKEHNNIVARTGRTPLKGV